ncbi:MAG: hypothetical protein RMK34_06010 [Tepidimonas sp.]|uniref:HAD family hydrolase n=1 Tax=Tepidimonas sp. TaxID=2002775 RepID=UPI00298F202A|nr:hypothetical protein [Tepidimonas sp.]MDW8336510.1 hypothetical protein [Tepidimonas sp.]
MKRPRLILDFDGTLTDCRRRQVVVARVIGRAFGIDIDPDRFWGMKRTGYSTLRIFSAFGIPDGDAKSMSDLWVLQIEGLPWLAYDRLWDGIRDDLLMVKLRGWEIVLLSARRSVCRLRWQLETLGLSGLLDRTIVVDPGQAVAKKAEALKKWIPNVYIGDSEADLMAAKMAGVQFIGVVCGQRSREFLARLVEDESQVLKENTRAAIFEALCMAG